MERVTAWVRYDGVYRTLRFDDRDGYQKLLDDVALGVTRMRLVTYKNGSQFWIRPSAITAMEKR